MKHTIDSDDDFGFSAISAEEYEAKIKHHAEIAKDETSIEYEKRLEDLEKIILPFLEKLRDTGDKEYIFWPNRKPAIDKQIERIKKLTRG
jgi:hypothetical protein